MTIRTLAHRLFALITARRLDAQLEDEMQAHLELAERDAIASGLSPEQARRVPAGASAASIGSRKSTGIAGVPAGSRRSSRTSATGCSC